MKKYYKIIIAIGLLIIVSCSRESSHEKENVADAFALVSNEVTPGDYVEIKFSKKNTVAEIGVMLGNIPIKAYSMGESYVFIMPVVSSGDYDVKLPEIDSDLILKLKVKEYISIAKPQEVIDDYLVKMDACFDIIKQNKSSVFAPTSAQTLILLNQLKEGMGCSNGRSRIC